MATETNNPPIQPSENLHCFMEHITTAHLDYAGGYPYDWDFVLSADPPIAVVAEIDSDGSSKIVTYDLHKLQRLAHIWGKIGQEKLAAEDIDMLDFLGDAEISRA